MVHRSRLLDLCSVLFTVAAAADLPVKVAVDRAVIRRRPRRQALAEIHIYAGRPPCRERLTIRTEVGKRQQLAGLPVHCGRRSSASHTAAPRSIA